VSKAAYGDLDLWCFDLESGVRVTCDVGYLCANFSLIGLSVLDLGPMYATDVRPVSLSAGSIIALCPRLLGAGSK